LFVTEDCACDLQRNIFGWTSWHANKLHQYDEKIWRPALEEITGLISMSNAALRLMDFAHKIDHTPYGYWHMGDNETNAIVRGVVGIKITSLILE